MAVLHRSKITFHCCELFITCTSIFSNLNTWDSMFCIALGMGVMTSLGLWFLYLPEFFKTLDSVLPRNWIFLKPRSWSVYKCYKGLFVYLPWRSLVGKSVLQAAWIACKKYLCRTVWATAAMCSNGLVEPLCVTSRSHKCITIFVKWNPLHHQYFLKCEEFVWGCADQNRMLRELFENDFAGDLD